jgi:hypothetical protein
VEPLLPGEPGTTAWGGWRWHGGGGGGGLGDLIASLTAHHSPTLNYLASGVRLQARFVRFLGLVCAGGAPESVSAVVLMDQRHRRLSSALSAPAHGCAATVDAQLGGSVEIKVKVKLRIEGEQRGNGASALRTCMLRQCALQLRDR